MTTDQLKISIAGLQKYCYSFAVIYNNCLPTKGKLLQYDYQSLSISLEGEA